MKTLRTEVFVTLVLSLQITEGSLIPEEADTFNCDFANLQSTASALSSIIPLRVITLVTDVFYKIPFMFLHSIQSRLGPLQLSEFSNISSSLTIIILNNGRDILNSSSEIFWSPSYYFIIYSFIPIKDQNTILEHLWSSYRVYNVFFITDLCSKTVLSFNPATNIVEEMEANNATTLKSHLEKRLYYWNSSKLILVFSYANVSYENDGVRLRNFFDDRLLFTVAESMRTKPKFIGTSDRGKYGVKFDNGTYGGSFKDLMSRNANMTAKGHFIKWYNTDQELIFSHYITLEKVCFSVPKHGQIPHLLATLMSLDIYVWVYLFLLYSLTGMSFSLLRKIFSKSFLRRRLKIKLRNVNTILMMFSYFLGLSFPYDPKLVFERLILSAMLLISFIIFNFFQTTLVTVLTAPVYYKNIETTEELIKSGIEIWSSSEDLIASLQEAGLQEVKFHLRTPQERIQPFKDDVGWIEKLNFLIDIQQLMYANERSYLVRQCPLFYFTAFMMPRGSALEHRVGNIVSRLSESGLIAKWLRMKFDSSDSEIVFKTGRINVFKIKPLSLHDFDGCFELLGWCMLISFTVFILELISAKINICISLRRKKKFA